MLFRSFGGGAIGWASFARGIDEAAAALAAAGIGRGAVVAWLGLNSPAMLAMRWACARRGALLMPLNWRLAPPEHRAMLAEASPAVFVAEPIFAAASAAAGVAPVGTRCVLVDEGIDAAAQGAAPASAGTVPPLGWPRWADFIAAGAGRGGQAADAGAPDPHTPLLLCYTSG
mgnify:FL=1